MTGPSSGALLVPTPVPPKRRYDWSPMWKDAEQEMNSFSFPIPSAPPPAEHSGHPSHWQRGGLCAFAAARASEGASWKLDDTVYSLSIMQGSHVFYKVARHGC